MQGSAGSLVLQGVGSVITKTLQIGKGEFPGLGFPYSLCQRVDVGVCASVHRAPMGAGSISL